MEMEGEPPRPGGEDRAPSRLFDPFALLLREAAVPSELLGRVSEGSSEPGGAAGPYRSHSGALTRETPSCGESATDSR